MGHVLRGRILFGCCICRFAHNFYGSFILIETGEDDDDKGGASAQNFTDDLKPVGSTATKNAAAVCAGPLLNMGHVQSVLQFASEHLNDS